MNKTRHPMPSAIRLVANRLESMIPQALNGNVKMYEPTICKTTNECETQACHAGFYELENALRNTDKYFFDPVQSGNNDQNFLHKKWNEDTTALVTWKDGANRMAHDLGFDSKEDLEEWAMSNPVLWGNEKGYDMFESVDAINSECGIIKLSEIVSHWRDVAERIEKLDQV